MNTHSESGEFGLTLVVEKSTKKWSVIYKYATLRKGSYSLDKESANLELFRESESKPFAILEAGSLDCSHDYPEFGSVEEEAWCPICGSTASWGWVFENTKDARREREVYTWEEPEELEGIMGLILREEGIL